jgi:uncharacterized protein
MLNLLLHPADNVRRCAATDIPFFLKKETSMAFALNDMSLEERFSALDDQKARFVSRVYSALSVSLLAAAAVCGFAITVFQTMDPIAVRSTQMTVGIIYLCVVIASMFIRVQGTFGWVFLSVFVGLTGLVLAPVMIRYSVAGVGTIAAALALTGGIFIGLTAYVRFSGKDFSYLGGFLWMATIGLCITSLLFLFFPQWRGQVNFWFSGIGALIFCGWILFDTSAITRQYYHENNVPGAVLNLFVDIVQLFLYILRMLSDRNRS